jgi:phosphate transport system permease protein
VEIESVGHLIKFKKRLKTTKIKQTIGFIFVWFCGFVSLAAVFWIIGYVLLQGFQEINYAFLFTRPAGGVSGEGGISTTIVSTVYLVILTLVIATPLGVGAAIYLVEYSGDAIKESKLVAFLVDTAKTGVDLLAGVPSIVFGLFGFSLFVIYLRFGFSLLSASLSGAALVLPTIIRTSEEALLTVPRSYREGSLSLGATRWHTIVNVVLPSAMPGIVTGIVLSVGRIIAETAIFWVTLGGSFYLPKTIMHSGRSLALHVYMLASETRAFDKAMATSAILILTIILLNLVINFVSRRFTSRLMGKS